MAASSTGGAAVTVLNTPTASTFTGIDSTFPVIGQPGRDNYFVISPGDLGPSVVLLGTSSDIYFDYLVLAAPGIVAPGQFDGVCGADILLLCGGGNTVGLTDALAAGTSHGIFSVISASGCDSVDASAVTNGSRIAFYAGEGNDTFVGGNGNDYIEFAAPELTAEDFVAAGAGFDYLALSSAGTVGAAAFAHISGIEALMLSAFGNSVTLTNDFVAGSGNGVMAVMDGCSANTIDASGVTNGIRVAFFGSDEVNPVVGVSRDLTFIGGNGNDYLSLAAGHLSSADHIDGGAGYDIIEFASPHWSIDAASFAHVTGVDELILNAGGNAVTLSDGIVAGADNGVLVILDGAGNDTVDASAVMASRVIFASSGGNDSFIGGGGSDIALFSAQGLTAGDAFAGGTGFDILQFTTAGTIDAAAFAHVSGLDELFLNLPGNSITLGANVVASADDGVLVVYDAAGHNTIDAGAATLGGRVVFLAAAGDHDTYIGGSGSDFFLFGADNLNASDTLVGGGESGTDFLVVTTPGEVAAADLANVSQIEAIELQAGGSIAFGDTIADAAQLQLIGSAAADTFDGSAVTAHDLIMRGNGGADTLKGGAGNDQFFVSDDNFAAIDGGAGLDTLVLGSAFADQTFDLSAHASRLQGIEVIDLDHAAHAILTVNPSDVLYLGAPANALYAVAGSDDEVNLNGDWSVVATGVVNAVVSTTHTFTQFHHASGADLFVDSLVAFTTAWDL